MPNRKMFDYQSRPYMFHVLCFRMVGQDKKQQVGWMLMPMQNTLVSHTQSVADGFIFNHAPIDK